MSISKRNNLVIPEVQNGFTNRLFKNKQISYSDRFVGFSDKENTIVLTYLDINMYLMKFFKALGFLLLIYPSRPTCKFNLFYKVFSNPRR